MHKLRNRSLSWVQMQSRKQMPSPGLFRFKNPQLILNEISFLIVNISFLQVLVCSLIQFKNKVVIYGTVHNIEKRSTFSFETISWFQTINRIQENINSATFNAAEAACTCRVK